MPQDDALEGQTRSLVHSSSPMASDYDGYIDGMSSDSELTTSGVGVRHNHHQYHHRPYSSQSRVYYAHPMPRNSPASSRLSHYSDSAAFNMQSSSSSSSKQPAQADAIGQPAPYPIMPVGTGNTSLQQHGMVMAGGSVQSSGGHQMPPTLSHKASVSSSGSASSTYLAGIMVSESPISPIMMQQQGRPKTGTGRQLPQGPFKQSMSIDHHHQHSYGSSHYSGHVSDHTSPVHYNQQSNYFSRNMMDSPVEPQTAHQHISVYHNQSGGLQQDLELMEKQTADLNLYDTSSEHELQQQQQQQQQYKLHSRTSAIGLPPRVLHQSSSATTARQLPTLGQQHGLISSISLEQRNNAQHHSQSPMHFVDSYPQHHQHPQLHHQPTDPYSSSTTQRQHQTISSAPHQQTSSAPADWLPPTGISAKYTRQTGQFKQAMSIDQYKASSLNRQQQQQQQHYSPSRMSPQVTEDNYHSLCTYSNQPKQNQQSIDSSYDSTRHPNQHQDYYSSNQDALYYQSSTRPRADTPEKVMSGSYDLSKKSGYDIGGSSMSSNVPTNAGISTQPSSNQIVRAKQLQHQMSDSSSNSNLSGSLRGHNMEVGGHSGGTFTRETTNSEQPKSVSSASSHFQQSPQHKMSTNSAGAASGIPNSHHYGRQDILRRGYTSAAMTAVGYNDLSGSQSALSEAGDLSISHASHSGTGHSSGRKYAQRAASPLLPHEGTASYNQSHHHHQPHHSASSSHGAQGGIRSESSTGLPNGQESNSTLTKKSNSATQLSMTGTKKRLGFRKKQVTSFSVHRSEEVAPLEARHLVKQGSSVSEGDSSMSGDSSSRSWSNSNFKQQTSDELASMSFIDGLGKGQMISRQGLASPYLGDIQLSLCDRRGNLDVDVIRARNLQAKTNKIPPLTYVKLYLVKNRKCLAKAKTTLSSKRTLNPLFQQTLTFHEDYHGCILQSIVWGNFGKMDKKNFMGIAQISIDDLELSDTVISWYKLFLPSSLQTLPSKSLRHTLLSNSTESFTNTNNS